MQAVGGGVEAAVDLQAGAARQLLQLRAGHVRHQAPLSQQLHNVLPHRPLLRRARSGCRFCRHRRSRSHAATPLRHLLRGYVLPMAAIEEYLWKGGAAVLSLVVAVVVVGMHI